MQTHKDLDVWKLGIDLVVDVYSFCDLLPTAERYGLVSQMQRSAVSIPSNIAEGSARRSKNELIQFLHIALGSLAELETQIIIVKEIKMVASNDYVLQKIEVLRKKLLNYRRYVKENYV
jgi:four helix bundle protein